LVALSLLLAIACHLFGTGLAILLPVLRMSIPPLTWTLQAYLPVNRIGSNFVPVIIPAALPLAFGLAANELARVIGGRLKNSPTVTTMGIAHRAAPDQNASPAFCPDVTGFCSCTEDHYVYNKSRGRMGFCRDHAMPHQAVTISGWYT
jgi:hypothetical protein